MSDGSTTFAAIRLQIAGKLPVSTARLLRGGNVRDAAGNRKGRCPAPWGNGVTVGALLRAGDVDGLVPASIV